MRIHARSIPSQHAVTHKCVAQIVHAGPDFAFCGLNADASKDDKKAEAFDRVLEVLTSIEQDYDPLWGSLLKTAIRRVFPGFNEGYYGYRSFSAMLEDLKSHNLIELEYDESRGNYKVRRAKD